MVNQRITAEEFERIRRLVRRNMGVNLTDAKKQLVISRLTGRLRALGIDTFTDYLDHLDDHEEELEVLVNLISTNVTHFFRESYHYQFLQEVFFEEIANQKETKELRAWSAGCSTGEEVYSLAITICEYFRDKPGWNLKLLASDINTDVIHKAREGIYTYEQVKGIESDLLPCYFRLGTGPNRGLFKVKENLKQMVTWMRINLVDPEYPISRPLDFLFCRNVFIYFDRETQNAVIARFHRYLRHRGCLFLGHSETISPEKRRSGRWKLLKKSIYRRC